MSVFPSIVTCRYARGQLACSFVLVISLGQDFKHQTELVYSLEGNWDEAKSTTARVAPVDG